MKPYDFYKEKFRLKDPEKERIRKYNEKDNYDFPFFIGKDAHNKTLDMTPLIYAHPNFPTNKEIRTTQAVALTKLYYKIVDNLGGGKNVQEMQNFIEEIGKMYSKTVKSDQYFKIKSSQTSLNKKMNELFTQYNIEDIQNKTQADLESIVKKKLDEQGYTICKRKIRAISTQLNILKKSANTFIKQLQSDPNPKTGLANWNELKEIQETLKAQLKELRNISQIKDDNEFVTQFTKLIQENKISNYQKAINHAANIISGSIGEFVTYTVFKEMIKEHNKNGLEFLDMINTGSLYQRARIKGQIHTIKFRVDHILVNAQNADLPIQLTVKETGASISTTLIELNQKLSQIEKDAKKKKSKATVIVENWNDIIKSNKLAGYTIQTKFRQNPNSILNNNEISRYSINELIAETKNLNGMFKFCAHNLDLFVRWYEASAAYWDTLAEDDKYPSRVLASYSEKKPNTILYGQYFNYLLSRTEAIEKIYTPSLFWYITIDKGFSLQNYIAKKLKQSQDAIISARSPVDLSQPDKSLAINVGHLIPTYGKDDPNEK